MPNEVDLGLEFPVGGINVASEFSRPPEKTSQSCVNVRAYDTLAERERGGSRPGLTKLVETQLNGDNPIQHLAIIVDPTLDALDADTTAAGGGSGTLDPSTNNLRTRNFGRLIPDGGNGRQPSINENNRVPTFPSGGVFTVSFTEAGTIEEFQYVRMVFGSTGNGEFNGVDAVSYLVGAAFSGEIPDNFASPVVEMLWYCADGAEITAIFSAASALQTGTITLSPHGSEPPLEYDVDFVPD